VPRAAAGAPAVGAESRLQAAKAARTTELRAAERSRGFRIDLHVMLGKACKNHFGNPAPLLERLTII
jgi:hypothetical protein